VLRTVSGLVADTRRDDVNGHAAGEHERRRRVTFVVNSWAYEVVGMDRADALSSLPEAACRANRAA
jgi:hypothetical protein